MKFLRPLLVLVVLLILIGATFWWWSTPRATDMADYAPADSIVYVEFNNLAAVAHAIQNSEAWQAAEPITQSKPATQNRFMTAAARAGIGPLPAVLFARAQIALVVVGLNTSEENDTLKVRPEVAIIAETHTSHWRTKPAAVEAVKHLANFAYGGSMCSERSADADYIDCSVAGGERKIVGAVDGTLVVVGNSDNAVRSCLEVRRGVRPSIHTDTEMLKVRSSLASDKTLGFGYISPANSAKLFSWATRPEISSLSSCWRSVRARFCAASRGPPLRRLRVLKIAFSSRSSPALFRVYNRRLRPRNAMRAFGNSCLKVFSH